VCSNQTKKHWEAKYHKLSENDTQIKISSNKDLKALTEAQNKNTRQTNPKPN